MSSPAPLRLDFNAEPAPTDSSPGESVEAPHPSGAEGREDHPASAAGAAPRATTIFGEQDELPPTWSEHSTIFHTWAKCTRLQSIRRNRRITGNPGLREHCLNCISIAATHRRG